MLHTRFDFGTFLLWFAFFYFVIISTSVTVLAHQPQHTIPDTLRFIPHTAYFAQVHMSISVSPLPNEELIADTNDAHLPNASWSSILGMRKFWKHSRNNMHMCLPIPDPLWNPGQGRSSPSMLKCLPAVSAKHCSEELVANILMLKLIFITASVLWWCTFYITLESHWFSKKTRFTLKCSENQNELISAYCRAASHFQVFSQVLHTLYNHILHWVFAELSNLL